MTNNENPRIFTLQLKICESFNRNAKIKIIKMKKHTKNLIGLVLTAVFYVLIVMPIIIGENIRLPVNAKMFGAMLILVIGFPLVSFIIPGIIALNVYFGKKPFWKYFYVTGWIIFILILILYSFVLGNLKFMD